MPSDPLEDSIYLKVEGTIEDNYRDTTGGYIVSPSAVAALATRAALVAIAEEGYAIVPAASPRSSETPQNAQAGDGGISGRHDPSDTSTGLSDARADRMAEMVIEKDREATQWAERLHKAEAELETVRAALAEEREITTDYRRVNAEALADLDRVRDLHHVHSCAADGHALTRTPTPCVNDGVCSCGSSRCPTLAALDTPEETK